MLVLLKNNEFKKINNNYIKSKIVIEDPTRGISTGSNPKPSDPAEN
jgi:hypothetical protein